MIQNLIKIEEYTRKSPPCNYEAQLLRDHPKRIKEILAGNLVPPYELEIQTTSRCNLKCSHCLGRDFQRINHSMNQEDLELMLYRADEFKEGEFQIDTIKFCGSTGEPLLNPVTLDGIEISKDMGKNTVLFTNGTLLGRRIGNYHYYDIVAKADRINISLDADSEETFVKVKGCKGFDSILYNIGYLLDRKKDSSKVVVSYVINQQNYPGIIPIAQTLSSTGVDEIRYRVDFTDLEHMVSLSPVISRDLRTAEKLSTDEFKVVSVYSDDEIKTGSDAFSCDGMKCFNQQFWACIGSNCELYTCGHRTHGGVESLGSLREYSFRELWNGAKRKESLASLPDKYCNICSPSSSARNRLMNELSILSPKEMEALDEYIINGKK